MRSMRLPGWLGMAVSLVGLGLPACGPPYDYVLVDENGNQIRLDDIQAIVSSDLSEEQKRESLMALGITDDDLIDFLVSTDLPPS